MKDKPHSFDSFNISTLDDLRSQAADLNLSLPLSENLDSLKQALPIGKASAPNRLCVQPMEGCDASESGAPGELTLRRYRRFAEGGFGVIWIEATAVEARGRSNPRQLWLNRRNVDAFAEFVQAVRKSARDCWGHEVVLVLQLAHAGRYSRPEGVADPVLVHHDPVLDKQQGVPADYPVLSDDELERLREKFFEVSRLALDAGFDGVDIKSCNGCLLSDLLSATDRAGKYGGPLENRTRFLCDVIGELKNSHAGVFPAARVSLPPDPSEYSELAQCLKDAGAQLISISSPVGGSGFAEREEPLVRFMRQVDATRIVQQAVPDIPVVVGRLSWFRHFMPDIASGLISGGYASLVGFGRPALAYPALAYDILNRGQLDPDKCCINCDACIQLIRDGGHAGCVVMDRKTYGNEYRHHRYFALDNLRDEARRCRGCDPAPCRTACPTHIDVPAFLAAFADGDVEKAYRIIRDANCLPGMCSHLCPLSTLCEGHCVASVLDGSPVPIHDIQYAVYWNALCDGFISLNLPETGKGKKVAVVGAGPAGISCAVSLLEQGHHVVIFERSSRLGGTPELLIRSSRFAGAHEEAEHLLRPALFGARLSVRYNTELGSDISLEELRSAHDAVFLACGVWGEKSLGNGAGVLAGIDFLRRAKSGSLQEVPERVVLLAGGDSAMDCAKLAFELGARELLIVYAGALSEMHWHMEDSWFRTEGVHLLTMTRPLCYRLDEDGKLTGLEIQRSLTSVKETLETTMVIEAMGLSVDAAIIEALSGCSFSEKALLETGEASCFCGIPAVFAAGGMVNGGDSVVQCIAEGMRAGREIDGFLS